MSLTAGDRNKGKRQGVWRGGELGSEREMGKERWKTE